MFKKFIGIVGGIIITLKSIIDFMGSIDYVLTEAQKPGWKGSIFRWLFSLSQNYSLDIALLIVGLLLLFVFIWPMIEGILPFSIKNRYYNQRFQNQIIKIDNKYYNGCVFENCTIRWSGKKFALLNANFVGYTRFETERADFRSVIDILKIMGFLEPNFAASWQHLPDSHFR